MHLHSQPRKLIAMQPPRRIIPNFPHVARLQSPHRASRHRRRHLPPRQHISRPKRHLRPAFRILRHRNNRVRSVQPHPNQIHSRLRFHPTSIIPFISIFAREPKSHLFSSLIAKQKKNAVIPSEARNLLFDAAPRTSRRASVLSTFSCPLPSCLFIVTSLPHCFFTSPFSLLKSRCPPNHHPANHQHPQTHHTQYSRRHPTKIHPRHSRHRPKINKDSRRPRNQNPIHQTPLRRDFPLRPTPIHPRLDKLLRQPIPIALATRPIPPLHLLGSRRRRKRDRPH